MVEEVSAIPAGDPPILEYPKVLYHATLPWRVVNDAAEHRAARAGWFESPAAVTAAAEAAQTARAKAGFENVRRVQGSAMR